MTSGIGAPVLARVIRSDVEESIHHGDVAVADPEGTVVAGAGDPRRIVFARSAMKPLQAAVSLSLAPFDFTNREIAVMCGSHDAEWVQLEAVRSILARARVDPFALQSPAVLPRDEDVLTLDPEPRRINSGCSGKHAGMLAACTAQGWPLETYRDPDHPLQQAVLLAVRRAGGVEDVGVGVDGCGVPAHSLPLAALATLYARLAAPSHLLGDLAEHAARAVASMRAEPGMVAGKDRAATALMRSVPDVVAKGGAEGLFCAALVERRLGVAVKVRDGSPRAAAPALIRALTLLGAVDGARASLIRAFARPPVLGGDEPVGEVVSDFEFDGAAA